jgi:acyl carrier protein
MKHFFGEGVSDVAESIETRVMAAIARMQYIDVSSLSPAATFDQLGMTSLDALALINELEEEFKIEIPNDQAMLLSTVKEAVECVRSLAPPGTEGAEGAGPQS